MRYALWFLGLFVLASLLAVFAQANQGYVLFIYPPYRLDISLNLVILLMITLVVGSYGIVRLVLKAISLPDYVQQFRAAQKAQQAQQALLQSIIAFFEGRFVKAEKKAMEAYENGGSTLVTHLIAAHAAHRIKKATVRDAYLHTLETLLPNEKVARTLSQVEFLVDSQKVEEAAKLVEDFQLGERGGYTSLLRLRLRIEKKLKHWDNVLHLLTELEKRKALEPIVIEQSRIAAYVELLKHNAFESQTLKDLWEKIPLVMRSHPYLIKTVVDQFIILTDGKNASIVLEQALNHQWETSVLELYTRCHIVEFLSDTELTKQIEQAETWLKTHSDEVALLRLLGQFCAKKELWGKAQSYLEASLSIEEDAATFLILGQLLEQQEQMEQAHLCYKRSAELALKQPVV